MPSWVGPRVICRHFFGAFSVQSANPALWARDAAFLGKRSTWPLCIKIMREEKLPKQERHFRIPWVSFLLSRL